MLALLKSLPLTFYSAPFYAHLVRKGRGMGLGFLLFISILGLGQAFTQSHQHISAFWAEKDALFEQLPDVTIQGGQLSVQSTGPLLLSFLEGEKDGPMRLLFDTSLDNSNTDRLIKKMDDENIFLLVTKAYIIIYNKAEGQSSIKDVKDLKDTELHHEDWIKAGKALSYALLPAMALSLVILMFFAHFFGATIGAVLLLILSPLFKIDLTLKPALRLASAAKVPGAFIGLLATPWPLLQLLLWLGFAIFGLLCVRKAEQSA